MPINSNYKYRYSFRWYIADQCVPNRAGLKIISLKL